MPLTLCSIHIYPVKGFKGISLEAARCTDRGLEHDRRWMVVDSEGTFISQRSHPRMATIGAEIEGDKLVLSAPYANSVELPLEIERDGSVSVRVWSSTVKALQGPHHANTWLSQYLRQECFLVYMPESSMRNSDPKYAGPNKQVGFADGFAYLVTTEASLADLNAKLHAKRHPALPMDRFRPNFVIAGARPFEEDSWKRIRIGEAMIQGVKPCGRCRVTTTDQSTGEVRGPEPLATLAGYRESRGFGAIFGINCVTVETGTVRVGDAINAA